MLVLILTKGGRHESGCRLIVWWSVREEVSASVSASHTTKRTLPQKQIFLSAMSGLWMRSEFGLTTRLLTHWYPGHMAKGMCDTAHRTVHVSVCSIHLYQV